MTIGRMFKHGSSEEPDRSAPDTAPSGRRGGLGSAIRRAVDDGQAANAEHRREVHESYGSLVKKAQFGGEMVEIYDRGFVRVGRGLLPLTASGHPFEKLLSIESRNVVTDKSAGGRWVAAKSTGGVSKMFSNEKNTVFLTIATDKKVHTLQELGAMGKAMALEAVGKSVLDSPSIRNASGAQEVPPRTETVTSVGDQLRELAALHTEGILTDEEFAAAKTKLITDV